MVNFSKWLDDELLERNWTRAELSRRADVSQSALSMIYSGGRKPGTEVCEKIAKALRAPPEEVYRRAGLLSSRRKRNKTINEILHIMDQLDPENQEEIAEYVKMRLQIQEKKSKKKADTKNGANNLPLKQ